MLPYSGIPCCRRVGNLPVNSALSSCRPTGWPTGRGDFARRWPCGASCHATLSCRFVATPAYGIQGCGACRRSTCRVGCAVTTRRVVRPHVVRNPFRLPGRLCIRFRVDRMNVDIGTGGDVGVFRGTKLRNRRIDARSSHRQIGVSATDVTHSDQPSIRD